MAAGFEVRNHIDLSVMVTIQVLVDQPMADVDLDRAEKMLTATYAAAFAELTQRVEEDRMAGPK